MKTKSEAKEDFWRVARFMENATDAIHLARQSMIALKQFSGFANEDEVTEAKMKQLEHDCNELARMMRKREKEAKNEKTH